MCCNKSHNLIWILGKNGEIMFLNLQGEFMGTLKHPGNSSLNEHNIQFETSGFLSTDAKPTKLSIYAFTCWSMGEDTIFVGTMAGELLVYSLHDFSILKYITNLGSSTEEIR